MKRIKQNSITAGSNRVVYRRRHHRRDQLDIITMKSSSSILLVYTVVLIAVISVSGFSPPRHRHRPSMYSSSFAMNRYHHTPTLSRIKDNQQRHDMRSNKNEEIGGNLHSKPSSSKIQSSSSNNNAIKILSRSIIPSLTLAILLLFSINPNPANAGFGPSGGATTSSPPNLTTPSKIGVQDTSEKKLKQLIGSTLNPNRLEEFNAQLDDITQTIMSIISSEDEVGLLEEYGDKFITEETTSTESSTNTQPNSIEEREAALKASLKKRTTKDNLTLRQEQQAELERLQVLKLQIANQEKMLSKLEAQPCELCLCICCVLLYVVCIVVYILCPTFLFRHTYMNRLV